MKAGKIIYNNLSERVVFLTTWHDLIFIIHLLYLYFLDGDDFGKQEAHASYFASEAVCQIGMVKVKISPSTNSLL